MAGSPLRSIGRITRPELAVFVSGVASMGLEILAGRIVAPQFGNSIYTWGTIIGVFLAALSLGYHAGGKRAASRASDERLAWLLLGTAAYVAALIFAGDLLLASASLVPLPDRMASLPAVTLLFGPPTYLLGYISPYAAELSGTDAVGEASGRVYAVGTAGSILGAFGTTFLLIPSLSVEQIGFAFGILLVATAALLLVPPVRRDRVFGTLAVALLLVGAVASGAFGVSAGGQVVYQTQTPYQELEVTDRGDIRTLYLDGRSHSAMDLDDPDRHVFTYTRYFHLSHLFAEDPDAIDRVLFIGGGGFTGPKRFETEYDVTIDVAEIDPEVSRIAEEYFRVEPSASLAIHTVDGRQFLRETDETYDVIVLDAYKVDKVPFQLTTVELMQLVSDRLADDGVLVVNLISAPAGPASDFYRAEYRTMQQAFPQVYSFPTVGGTVVQNVMLVATKNDTRIAEATLHERNRERDIGVDLDGAVRTYRVEAPGDDVPILRDDRAPVDRLLGPMVGQRYVVEQTTPAGQAG